jgi:hypothetical protein
MNVDPLGTALKEISEVKNLLGRLITSSESFDYPQAKVALKKLDHKVRELARLQAKYQRLQDSRRPNIYVLDFKNPAPAEMRSP